jgi:hypothetical protein
VGSTATAFDFCKTFSDITADKFGQCWSAAPAVIDELKAQDEVLCPGMQAEVDAGRAVYDPGKGGSCARTLASLDGCTVFLDFLWVGPEFRRPVLPADCAAALIGAVAPGGQCSQSMDCAGGYCNAPMSCGGPALSGQCVAFPTEGQPCPAGVCLAGLGCNFAFTSAAVCVALSAADGPCPCQAGLYCDTSGATPNCKATTTNGFCTTGLECAPGYECSGVPKACIPLVGLGARCGGLAECGMGYYCDSGSGTCAPQPTIGQSCVLSRNDTTAQLQCIGGWCDAAGTKACQPRKADGQTCTSYDECIGYCDTSTQTCAGASQGPGCIVPL